MRKWCKSDSFWPMQLENFPFNLTPTQHAYIRAFVQHKVATGSKMKKDDILQQLSVAPRANDLPLSIYELPPARSGHTRMLLNQAALSGVKRFAAITLSDTNQTRLSAYSERGMLEQPFEAAWTSLVQASYSKVERIFTDTNTNPRRSQATTRVQQPPASRNHQFRNVVREASDLDNRSSVPPPVQWGTSSSSTSAPSHWDPAWSEWSAHSHTCPLYPSDAADDLTRLVLGALRIIYYTHQLIYRSSAMPIHHIQQSDYYQ